MQFARSIFERVTTQAIIPMVTLGVSAAIATMMLELVYSWRETKAFVAQRY
jgi:hypothetical protein